MNTGKKKNMNSYEERKVTQWGSGLSNDIEIKLNLTSDDRSKKLRSFCNALSTLASRVNIVENESDSPNLPSIEVSKNLRYSAVPEGPQLESFLQALTMRADDFAFLPKSTQAQISKIDTPTLLTIFVSQQCPHCPASVRQLIPLAFANQMIEVEVIDGPFFGELAQSNNIECLPTTLMGSDFRWSGVTPLEDIVEVITNRDSSQFSAPAIERMLEERNALKVAGMMLEAGRLHPALFDAMIDERFFLRLGAMTAIEDIINQDAELATQIVAPLWERFGQAIEPMQIDIIYLIGDAGKPENIPLLESVLNGDFRDNVKETAREAIESIKERHAS